MSYTMAQALYLLSRNPDVQDEARARVLQAGDAGKGPGDPFVLNILHETMRLFPPVPFSSKISETRSIEVEGINIPAKTNVMWMKTAVGLNEAFFADAPRFNPCRFAAGPGGERPAESIASAMPFGAGARHCIGRHQAEYLLHTLPERGAPGVRAGPGARRRGDLLGHGLGDALVRAGAARPAAGPG